MAYKWQMLCHMPNLCSVDYCKRGYFRWGKISRKCWQYISRGGNFHDTTPFSFIKSYGFYFRVGVIFAKKTKAQKSRKLPPRENFHVYSILELNWLFNVTINDISVIYVTAHRCAGGPKKKLDLRSGSHAIDIS